MTLEGDEIPCRCLKWLLERRKTRENDSRGSETIAPATQNEGSHSPLNQGHIRP